MNGIKCRYISINILAILITIVLFIKDYKDVTVIFQGRGLAHILIIVVTVFVVHFIKAGRLYFALYGSNISIGTYLKIYCKVTPVSVVIPFKLGEFFRMYCYGKVLGDALKGIVIVVLDRFMDTLALVSIVFIVWFFNGGNVAAVVYILLLFLVFALFVFYALPGVYTFWKHYILKSRATDGKLLALSMLEAVNRIYEEIKGVSTGRGIILYFMSLLAWIVEIGSVALQIDLLKVKNLNQVIADYLTSAIGSTPTVELKQFVFVSIVMLIVIYSITKLLDILSGRKEYE